jgi:hypothetical protein
MSREWFDSLDEEMQQELIDIMFKLRTTVSPILRIKELEHKLENNKNDKKGLMGERWIHDILAAMNIKFEDVSKQRGNCDIYCESGPCKFLIESKNCEVVSKKHIEDFKNDVLYSVHNDKNDINFAIFVAHRHKHFETIIEFIPIMSGEIEKVVFLMYIADAFTFPDRLISGIDICKSLSSGMMHIDNIVDLSNSVSRVNLLISGIDSLKKTASEQKKCLSKQEDILKQLLNEIHELEGNLTSFLNPVHSEVLKIARELGQFTSRSLEDEITKRIPGLSVKPGTLISNMGGINHIKNHIKNIL